MTHGDPTLSAKVDQAGPRWDTVVRLTHWGIAAEILLNALLVDEESEAHILIGYTALALLLARMLWGLVGSPEARFAAFPPSLARAKDHLSEIAAGEVRPHRSHNPLGALMAYAFWTTLAAVSVTGLMLEPDAAPQAQSATMVQEQDHDDDDHERQDHGEDGQHEIVEKIHEIGANLLLALAVLHVGGVVFETRRTGRDLVGPMTWRRAVQAAFCDPP